jgi:hypothetical protein|tara:strand:- start:995 stop:1264 length:270 start_codon:yes stop_codon:yes gene_type:complete
MAEKKTLIKLFEDIVAEEALDAAVLYDVKYEFHDYSGEVQTVYVVEREDTPQSVEFYMLKSLEKKLKKLSPRYQVGIIYEEVPDEDLED